MQRSNTRLCLKQVILTIWTHGHTRCVDRAGRTCSSDRCRNEECWSSVDSMHEYTRCVDRVDSACSLDRHRTWHGRHLEVFSPLRKNLCFLTNVECTWVVVVAAAARFHVNINYEFDGVHHHIIMISWLLCHSVDNNKSVI